MPVARILAVVDCVESLIGILHNGRRRRLYLKTVTADQAHSQVFADCW